MTYIYSVFVFVIPREGVESSTRSAENGPPRASDLVIPREGVESFDVYMNSLREYVEHVIPREGVESSRMGMECRASVPVFCDPERGS